MIDIPTGLDEDGALEIFGSCSPSNDLLKPSICDLSVARPLPNYHQKASLLLFALLHVLCPVAGKGPSLLHSLDNGPYERLWDSTRCPCHFRRTIQAYSIPYLIVPSPFCAFPAWIPGGFEFRRAVYSCGAKTEVVSLSRIGAT